MDTAPLTCYNRKPTTDMRKTTSEALISQTSAWEYVVQYRAAASHLISPSNSSGARSSGA